MSLRPHVVATVACLAYLLALGCVPPPENSNTGSGGTGSGGESGGTGGSGGSASGGAPSGSGGGASSGGASASGSGGSGSGGVGSGVSSSGGASSGGRGSGGASSGGTGSGGAPGSGGQSSQDHCVYGYPAEPTDETMADGPAEFYPPGNMSASIVDLTLQPEVLAWMKQNVWEAAHVEWHAIRSCSLPGGSLGSQVNICQYTNLIPSDQNCQTGGDGYQFLLFHRHMLESLKQLWPKHAKDFDGFPTFPQKAEDVPMQWRSAWQQWNATDLKVGQMLDNIDKPENLAKFPDEGTLGFYLQCQAGVTLKNAPAGFAMKSDGIHFDLHAKWVRTGNTAHGLNNTMVNVDNYMFWKLHGWIDNVWEKYRVAKGLKRTDQKYKDDMVAQCREMDTEEMIIKQHPKPTEVPDPIPAEAGFFHEMVRPILENPTYKCSACHSESGPEAGMSLGGAVSSRKIYDGLVGIMARGGGQYPRIKPGNPQESWLYLKITGGTGQCMPTATGLCSPGVMPPDASGNLAVSSADALVIKQWITDGAPAPTTK